MKSHPIGRLNTRNENSRVDRRELLKNNDKDISSLIITRLLLKKTEELFLENRSITIETIVCE